MPGIAPISISPFLRKKRGINWSSYWATQLLFRSGSFDFADSKLLDISSNGNDALLVGSYCGTAKIGTILTFSSALAGDIGDWTMTHQGTAVAVLELNRITFSTGGTIYDLLITNGTLSYHYPISENGYINSLHQITVFSVGADVNNIVVTGSTLTEWTAGTQNDYHYNLQHGGSKTSGELKDNGNFEGVFTSGLAAGWVKFNTTSETEETVIVHGGSKAQRITGGAGDVIYQTKPIRKDCTYTFGAWIYCVTGKGYVSVSTGTLYATKLQTLAITTKTEEWEYVVLSFKCSGESTTNFRVGCQAAGSEIIIDDVSIIGVSHAISIPALEAGTNDVLGRAIEYTGTVNSETSIKLPVDADLIAADVDDTFFTGGAAKEVLISSLPFALQNMVNNNRIFFDSSVPLLLIYQASIGRTLKLKSLLNYLSRPIYDLFKYGFGSNVSQYNWMASNQTIAINGKYRVSIIGYQFIQYSDDYGATWSGNYNWTSTNRIKYCHVTSMGTIMIVGGVTSPNYGNHIYISKDGAVSFAEVVPLDKNGDAIALHVPANALYPGNYYGPFPGTIMDIYDSDLDTNLIAWGNWGNTGGLGANPSNVFYSTDDLTTIKTLYAFGQNPAYTDDGTNDGGVGGTALGDATSLNIVRHIHQVKYNSHNGKYYVATGDVTGTEVQLYEFTYNKATDVWSAPVALLAASNQRHRMIDFGFDELGNIYWASDGSTGTIVQGGVTYTNTGVYKCPLADFDDLSKHIELYPLNIAVVTSYFDLAEGIIIFCPMIDVSDNSRTIYISNDRGATWVSKDASDYLWVLTLADIGRPQYILKDDRFNYFVRANGSVGGFFMNIQSEV